MSLLPPPARSGILQSDIDTLIQTHNIAKKYGQSGIKILSNHNFWIKDTNTNHRILLKYIKDQTIMVDGSPNLDLPINPPKYLRNKNQLFLQDCPFRKA